MHCSFQLLTTLFNSAVKMRKLAPLVATFLVCFTLLSLDQLQSTEARAAHHGRVKRVILAPQDPELQYLVGLYNDFLVVYKRDYQQSAQSTQFAVAAINRPGDLKPCPLVMNDKLGQISPDTHNYLAYTPLPSPTRPKGQIHAETNILNHYDAITVNVNVQSVYLVTHFSPCSYCTKELRKLVTQNRGTTFYIGYVERYQNEENLNYFIAQVGNEANVRYGQISPSASGCPLVYIELRHSNTCPVIRKCPSTASSGFPPTTMVYTGNPSSTSMKKMEDLLIGDEILTVNAQQQLLYDPVIAFLDQGHLSPSEFIEIETENNHKLQLTPSHLIFTSESSKPVYASNVTPGSYVFTLDLNDSVQPSKVTRVGTVTAVGKFAPLTAEGTILADGILASCYGDI